MDCGNWVITAEERIKSAPADSKIVVFKTKKGLRTAFESTYMSRREIREHPELVVGVFCRDDNVKVVREILNAACDLAAFEVEQRRAAA